MCLLLQDLLQSCARGGRAEALAGMLKRRGRWQTGRRTWQTMRALLGRAKASAGTFNAQELANTHAVESRAEALAGTFNSQDVANTQ